MAILEKEVWITLSANNIKYFEDLGYNIPRSKNKKDKLVVSKGTKMLVKVEDLFERSPIKVTKICDDCGKQKILPYYKITISREDVDGKDRCYKCSNSLKWEIRYENVPYEKTLEYYAKENGKEYLLEEFSSNNLKKANEIFKGSTEIYMWVCKSCNNEYDMTVNKRTNGRNCPYCSGYRINETNCLWSTHPEIAKLLKNPSIGYEITSGCNEKAEFTCPDCGNTDEKIINNITRKGFSCSKCSDGISYPEKFIISLLDQLNIIYERQKNFEWSNRKIYDFYILPGIIIETHGEQHYDRGFGCYGGRTLEEEKENDGLKEKLAFENGVNEYIVLDCRKSELDYVKKSIINSAFKKLYNLNSIDWVKAHEFASNTSMIKIACDLWNEGIENTLEISKRLKLSRNVVVRYLKQGKILGWCNYQYHLNPSNRKKTVQLTKHGAYIAEYESAAEAGRQSGVFHKNISQVCKGEKRSAGGYKWMYKEDYDKLIETKEIK